MGAGAGAVGAVTVRGGGDDVAPMVGPVEQRHPVRGRLQVATSVEVLNPSGQDVRDGANIVGGINNCGGRESDYTQSWMDASGSGILLIEKIFYLLLASN